jgi:hypothetical protein
MVSFTEVLLQHKVQFLALLGASTVALVSASKYHLLDCLSCKKGSDKADVGALVALLHKRSPPPPAVVQHIDEAKLETDLMYRFQYLCEFIGLDKDDISIIHKYGPALGQLVPHVVQAVYNKLFSYDCTKRHFVVRNAGFAGQTASSLEDLTLTHDQIKFRMDILSKYLVKVFTADVDAKLINYLDYVGKIHTTKSGSKSIQVPLVQMNVLWGWISDILVDLLFTLNLEPEESKKLIRAVNKLTWVQNDLISRHYVDSAQAS